MTVDVTEGDYLDAAAISAAFDSLTPGDKLKLSAIEAVMLRGTGLGKGDLIHEAVCRALVGRRHCPRSVPFMAFLVKTMQSIAHHARKKNRRHIPVTADAGASGHDPPAEGDPETDLIAREDGETVEAIHKHFEDDEEAGLVLMGWTEGLRGRELREAAGLDQGGLDYAAKRIRTKMRKLYPTGWLS